MASGRENAAKLEGNSIAKVGQFVFFFGLLGWVLLGGKVDRSLG